MYRHVLLCSLEGAYSNPTNHKLDYASYRDSLNIQGMTDNILVCHTGRLMCATKGPSSDLLSLLQQVVGSYASPHRSCRSQLPISVVRKNKKFRRKTFVKQPHSKRQLFGAETSRPTSYSPIYILYHAHVCRISFPMMKFDYASIPAVSFTMSRQKRGDNVIQNKEAGVPFHRLRCGRLSPKVR